VKAWFALYCAELGGVVPETIAEGIWQRILIPADLTGCLLAYRTVGDPVGFASYVLHPHTWSLQPVCYLEDLFIVPEARGNGAGRALIEALVALGRQKGWHRFS
jgi:GNAT superfamily N-acetyltransferase